MRLKKQLFFIVLLTFFTTTIFSAPTKSPQEYFFDSSFGDFSEELINAKEQGKKGILVFFEMDDCPFCHWMKKNVNSTIKKSCFFSLIINSCCLLIIF